jgi:replicative DNA helicase
MFIHRPEMYVHNRGREDLRGHARLIIGKQRDGQSGAADLIFIGAQTRFESAAEQGDE